MIIKAHGSFLSNIFYGSHVLDFLVPWKVEIDTVNKVYTVSKRNYHFIGVDKNIIPFRNIRRVNVDQNIFGADLSVKVYGSGFVYARCLRKKDVKVLVDYMRQEISALKRSVM